MAKDKEEWKPIEEDGDLETGDGKQRILVEIVSALCVPSMDKYSDADPYVSVFLKDEHIHKTKVIQDNPNPIWTLETGSLFLIEFVKEQMDLKADTVSFVLKDYSAMGKDETMGTVEIKLKDLVNGKGHRNVYHMDVPQYVLDYNKKKKRVVTKKTKLVLRFKPPSIEELHFLLTLQEGKDGIFANEAFLPPTLSRAKLDNKTAPQIRGWGAQLLGTATGDDGEETDTPMIAAMAPSEEWIEVGSGNEGRVYVEVLACNGLPNMDSATLRNFNNLTDAFCCLIVEDSIVNTSIIKDTLSPRWMPNDQRAFLFHVNHPSILYLSVFDHDKINRIGNKMRSRVHDPIGRVLINLTQFHPDTLYTLQYHIYPVDNDAEARRRDEKHNGTIILRLRVEWGDVCCKKENEAKSMLVAGMSPPPEHYLSVPQRHDFDVAHYTTVGEDEHDAFSMKTLTTYLDELKTYADEDVIAAVVEGVLTVLLWRGHWEVNCFCRTMHIPLHSIVAFTWGVLVTQNYNRLLSFLLFSVAWFFVATNELRRQHPSPWHKCKSCNELLVALLSGTFCGCIGFCKSVSSTKIEPNENLPAIQAYYTAEKERKQKLQKQKDQAAQDAAEMEEADLNKELQIESSSDKLEAVATAQKDSFVQAMNPLKPILHPVQKILRQVCCALRVIKSIVTWEENYYPFWIVTCSLMGSFLVFFIPWGFLLRWIVRIVVWVVLGPWMKLVDWFYFDKRDNMTADEIRDSIHAEILAEYKKRQEYQMLNQKMKEQSMKMRSMMKYLFGKFAVRVPRFREALFSDYPLPASQAEPFEHKDADLDFIGQICGQTLTGDMIPHRMIQEHPFIINSEPEEKETLMRNWGSDPKLAPSEDDEETPGEARPLLKKPSGKKKKKIFGLFKKLRG